MLASTQRSRITLGPATLDKSALLACWLRRIQTTSSERLMLFAEHQATNTRLPLMLRLTDEDAAMLTAMVTGDRTY